jgi:hypothetical protein
MPLKPDLAWTCSLHPPTDMPPGALTENILFEAGESPRMRMNISGPAIVCDSMTVFVADDKLRQGLPPTIGRSWWHEEGRDEVAYNIRNKFYSKGPPGDPDQALCTYIVAI